jgi:hypothetical protein
MSAFAHVRLIHLGLVLIAAAILVLLAFAPASMAAGNPSGSGQPNVSCGPPGPLTTAPAGFGTSGFTHAALVYAGSGKSVDNANSANAVSQYDVACYQLSTP